MKSARGKHHSGRNRIGKAERTMRKKDGVDGVGRPTETCATEAKVGGMEVRRWTGDGGLTPFMIGISEAGSVDMEASSRNTTGKSMTRSAADAEVIHVVHTYSRCQSGLSEE